MPDPNNWLTPEEKHESQQRWDERMAAIKTTATAFYSGSLKHNWLSGKLYDDMSSNLRGYGNRSPKDLAADLNCSEEHLQWHHKFYQEYDEAAVDDLAKSGLGWREVLALLHFGDLADRESARVRLVAKKIDCRQAMEEAERSKRREQARLAKERALAYEKKVRADLANNPAEFVLRVFQTTITRLSDLLGIAERTWLSYMNYRRDIEKMGFFHRLTVLTYRQACVEVLQYFSTQVADLANQIAQRVPELLPEAQQLQPLQLITDSSGLWQDLHACQLQLPNKKLGKGYTVNG